MNFFFLKSKRASVWLYQYKQLSINIGFSKIKPHITDSKMWLFSQILLFLPTLIIGFIYKQFGKRFILKQKKKDLDLKFEYNLTFVSIVKNEGPYLEEWVSYHHILGVDKFLIYDNNSDDNTKKILKPFIDKGIVEYIYFPGKAMQVVAYTDAINRFKNRTKLMGFIDLDEFVVLFKEANLFNFSDRIINTNMYAAGVAIQWLYYGSSGHEKKPHGLVIENYTWRELPEKNPLTKTIGNPRLMQCSLNPHLPIYKYGACNVLENGTVNYGPRSLSVHMECIRINHYALKSKEEFLKKRNRGFADTADMKRMDDWFELRDAKDVQDFFICKYGCRVRTHIDSLR